jgi:SnoaL-like domain
MLARRNATTKLLLTIGSMNNTLTIEQLLTRASITDLVHRYAKYIRDGDTAACEALFTEDASFATREMIPGQAQSVKWLNQLAGRDAIMKYLNRPEVRAGVCPSVSNLQAVVV